MTFRIESRPVLVIGGYGVTGAAFCSTVASIYPDVPLCIAGRDGRKAADAARRWPGAVYAQTDLAVPGLGIEGKTYSAVVVLAKDQGLHALDFCGRNSIPYLSVSSAAFDSGLDFVHGVAAAKTTAVVLAPHWFAGGVSLSVIEACRSLAAVDDVTVRVFISSGPSRESGLASKKDFERITKACSSTPLRLSGIYEWSDGESAETSTDVKGAVSVDVASIGAATGAQNVRVLEIWGPPESDAGSTPAADTVVVEITGRTNEGATQQLLRKVTIPHEGTSMTTLTMALILGKMLGVNGISPLLPGIYLPESVLEASTFRSAADAAGIIFSDFSE